MLFSSIQNQKAVISLKNQRESHQEKEDYSQDYAFMDGNEFFKSNIYHGLFYYAFRQLSIYNRNLCLVQSYPKQHLHIWRTLIN